MDLWTERCAIASIQCGSSLNIIYPKPATKFCETYSEYTGKGIREVCILVYYVCMYVCSYTVCG